VFLDYEPSEECRLLRFGEGTAWGVWVGPGANRDELLQFGQTLSAAGIQPAATVYGEPDTANLLHDAGWVVAWRPFIGDCPSFAPPPDVSAVRWVARALEASQGVRYTWLSLSNECIFPYAQYQRDWLRAAIEAAQAAGVPRLVPHVEGTGGPELDWVPVLVEAFQGHAGIDLCWGVNQYPYHDGMALDSGSVENQYTTFRLELYQHLLPVPVCVTEIARSWGEDVPVWSEYPGYVARMEGRLLWATFWYDAIPLGPWPNATLRGKLATLAAVLVE